MEKELGFAHFLAQVDGVGISTLTRTVAFQLTDGDGGTSATVSKPIFVTT